LASRQDHEWKKAAFVASGTEKDRRGNEKALGRTEEEGSGLIGPR
jgi:hypothetical protein